jgi:hypothetical protein
MTTQVNSTVLGTLGNLSVTGNISANSYVGGSVNVTGNVLAARGNLGTLSVTGNITSTGSIIQNGVTGGIIPVGGIIMWSGNIVSIPTSWALCNGSNGTPDLRSRFVIGAGSAYNVAATGGSANSVVVSHSHSVTDPGHNHDYRIGQSAGTLTPTIGGWSFVGTYLATKYNNFIQSASTGITVNSTGQSGIDANLPPYYALAYIMKTA